MVVLEGNLSHQGFLSAWKVFNLALSTLNFKADLVQLNGYYQYDSRLCIDMKIDGKVSENIWPVVQKVASGMDVGVARKESVLSESWGVFPDEVLGICRLLKKLGFEVRNSRTNPQMAVNAILIPYSFPTLEPSSVQLRKSL